MTPQEYNQAKVAAGLWDPETLFEHWPEARNEWRTAVRTGRWREFNRVVKEFQKSLGLVGDSKVGPLTMKAIQIWTPSGGTCLVIGGERVDIGWPVKLVRGLEGHERSGPPQLVVMHVDVTFSSASTFSVLKKRGLSSHFGIDGDDHGTIHQWLDPATHFGFHAGTINGRSIGVDINSPCSLRYAVRDARRRDRSRPVVKAKIRGRMKEHLGLFPEQVKALKLLAEVLEVELEIERKWPREDDGKIITRTWRPAYSWTGWIGHHHVHPVKSCPAATGVAVVDEVFPVEMTEQ